MGNMFSVLALLGAVCNGAELEHLTDTKAFKTLSDRLADSSDSPDERRRLYGRKYTKCECERPNEGAAEYNRIFCSNGEQFHCAATETCYRSGQFKMGEFLDVQEKPHFSLVPVTEHFKSCVEKDTDLSGITLQVVKENAECGGGNDQEKRLGSFASMEQCKTACVQQEGCNYFIYGKKGAKEGECFWEYDTACAKDKLVHREYYDVHKVIYPKGSRITWEVVKENAECDGGDGKERLLGRFPSHEQCKAACVQQEGCRYFIYGKSGAKATYCYWEYDSACFANNFVHREYYDVHKVVYPKEALVTMQVVKKEAECGGGHDQEKRLGSFASLEQCKTACAEQEGCRYFIYGKGAKAKECFWEYDAACAKDKLIHREVFDVHKVIYPKEAKEIKTVELKGYPSYYRATRCQVECQQYKACKFWTLGGNSVCYLMKSDENRTKYKAAGAHGDAKNVQVQDFTSGARQCETTEKQCIHPGTDLQGEDLQTLKDQTAASCQIACKKQKDCQGWTKNGGVCILKGFAPGKTKFTIVNQESTYISGIGKHCVPQEHGPVCRKYDPKDHIDGKVYAKGAIVSKDVALRSSLRKRGLDLRCPSKEKILRTPAKGTTGSDRYNEWACPGCDCGCSIHRGCNQGGEDNIPCCTQPAGSYRFPLPEKAEQALSEPDFPFVEGQVNNLGYHKPQKFTADGALGQFMSGMHAWYNMNPACNAKVNANCENSPDRVYRWYTTSYLDYLSPSASHTNIKQTGWLNGFDEKIEFTCPRGRAMIGIESEYSFKAKDRRFKATCAKMTGVDVLTATSRQTDWINTKKDGVAIPGRPINTDWHGEKCTPDEVMCGIYSEHFEDWAFVKNVPLKKTVEDRMWKLRCCRVMVAREQCHSISVDIRTVVVAKKTEPRETMVDKIQANACGHNTSVKGKMSKSRQTVRTRTSQYSLSSSWSRTFSSELSTEIGVSFSTGLEVGSWTSESGMTASISASAAFETTSSGETTSVETVETQEITSFEQGFEYEAAPNTRLVVTALGQLYEGDVFWTGMATCRNKAGVVLETKMVDGIYQGVGVNDIALQFQTEVCEHDGYTMERNRFCPGTDLMHRPVSGVEVPYSYKTSLEAMTACNFMKDCAGFVDDQCNNQGPFYLCRKDAILQYSDHTCSFARQVKFDAVENSKPADLETCKCANPGEGPTNKKIVCTAGKGKAFQPTAIECPKDQYCMSLYAVDKHTKIDVDAEQIKYLQEKLCRVLPNLVLPKPIKVL